MIALFAYHGELVISSSNRERLVEALLITQRPQWEERRGAQAGLGGLLNSAGELWPYLANLFRLKFMSMNNQGRTMHSSPGHT